MFGTHFYHQKIRKCVAIFGTLFNNIYVIRKNSAGAVISQQKVPLAYAPKEKYLERIRENPDLANQQKIAIKLPRMSFEIVGFAYDHTRQLSKVGNFNTTSAGTISKRQKFFTSVPYDISFQLNCYAKNQDDALQMVEQILPTFNPQYTLTIKPFVTEYPTFKEDIPIIINALTSSDDFEGALDQRRTIVYSFDFTMKVNFYGPIGDNSIIRFATTKLIEPNIGLKDSDVRLSTMTTKPDPETVFGMADSDFGFTTDIKYVYDSA
tara:strand:+ start:656 stop:1450 length:795 start_codon:yes stop_codon:yes gene_type:complete